MGLKQQHKSDDYVALRKNAANTDSLSNEDESSWNHSGALDANSAPMIDGLPDGESEIELDAEQKQSLSQEDESFWD